MDLHKALVLVGIAFLIAVAAGANARIGWAGLAILGLTLLV